MPKAIESNRPLLLLKEHLGLGSTAIASEHLLRRHGHLEAVSGIEGAALGYCQALFAPSDSPDLHTQKVSRLLTEIGAPWADSHELFWGYAGSRSPRDFLNLGMRPLLGTGRVPILITALNPDTDARKIERILETHPPVGGETTVLVRVVLPGDRSFRAAAELIRQMLARCRAESTMPHWWPLLQGDLRIDQWENLKALLGDDWRFVNAAINPFTPHSVVEFLGKQVTVGQIVVGHPDGIAVDGTIHLPGGMKIVGARECDSYSLPLYLKFCASLRPCPTLILLGPSLAGWTDDLNQRRVASTLSFLLDSRVELWGQPSDQIWECTA